MTTASWLNESEATQLLHNRYDKFIIDDVIENILVFDTPSNDDVFEEIPLKIVTEKSNSDQNRNRASKLRQKKRSSEKRFTAQLARDTLFSMKTESIAPENTYVSIDTLTNTANNKIDIEEVKYYLFNKKHNPEFSRLPSFLKLVLAQYIINNQPPETRAIPTPFVYRYSLDQQNKTQSQINKEILRKLTTILGRSPLFWLAPEFDDKKSQILTHSNGEILLYPDEFQLFIDTFINIHDKNIADSTKVNKMQRNKIIKALVPEREKWGYKVSTFYSIFNWVSYSTKQQNDRRQEWRRTNPREPYQEKDSHYYIPDELKKMAAVVYNNNIR